MKYCEEWGPSKIAGKFWRLKFSINYLETLTSYCFFLWKISWNVFSPPCSTYVLTYFRSIALLFSPNPAFAAPRTSYQLNGYWCAVRPPGKSTEERFCLLLLSDSTPFQGFGFLLGFSDSIPSQDFWALSGKSWQGHLSWVCEHRGLNAKCHGWQTSLGISPISCRFVNTQKISAKIIDGWSEYRFVHFKPFYSRMVSSIYVL